MTISTCKKHRWLPLTVLLTISLTGTVQAGSRYAVVVGHNLGRPSEEPLRFAERDARRFLDTMMELGAVREENAELLLGKTTAEVMAALDRVTWRMKRSGDGKREVTLFFYFAGHGDSDNLHLGSENLGRDELIKRLKQVPAALKLVVLDACHTVMVGRPRGVSAGPSFEIGLVQTVGHRGLVLIRSTQAGEPAHESDVLGGSIFTHYLVSALRGAADTDHDGRVTLMEAYTFAYRNTIQYSARGSAAIQHPSFDIEWAGSGELVWTTPSTARAVLVVPAGQEARLLIYQQPSGAVIAEVVSSTKRPITLAVPPGRFLIQRRHGQRFQAAQVELPFGGRYELTESDFEEQPYEKLVRRGGLLELHTNNLAVEYLLLAQRLPGDWILAQGVGLGYTLDLADRWELGVELQSTWSKYRQANFDRDETVLGLSGRIGYRIPLGVTILQLRAGPEVEVMFQNRVRSDREELQRVGIVSLPRRRVALGAGGGVEFRWWIPLGGRFGLVLGARFSLLNLSVEEDEKTAFQAIPVLGGQVGLGHRF